MGLAAMMCRLFRTSNPSRATELRTTVTRSAPTKCPESQRARTGQTHWTSRVLILSSAAGSPPLEQVSSSSSARNSPLHGRPEPQAIRCKAAVCRAAGEPLVVEEIVVDPPKAYEIRIKIVCTSLCHSDITFWRGKAATAFPRILGHEAYGVVESVGEHVEGFAAGDTVVPTFMGQCDRCPSCASEHNNLCTTVPFVFGLGMRRNGTTRFRDAQGNPLHDLVAMSSFRQYTVVDVTQVVWIDPAVPPKLACLLSCGASTGVGAAWRVAKVEPGSSVAIFGLGSVGLAVSRGADADASSFQLDRTHGR